MTDDYSAVNPRRADLLDTSKSLHHRAHALVAVAAALSGGGSALAACVLAPGVVAAPVPALLAAIGLLLCAGGCLAFASISKDRALAMWLESRFSVDELDEASDFSRRRSAQRALQDMPDFEWTEDGARAPQDNVWGGRS